MADAGRSCACAHKVECLEKTVHLLSLQVKTLETDMEVVGKLKQQMLLLQEKVDTSIAAIVPRIEMLLVEMEHHVHPDVAPPAAAGSESMPSPVSLGTPADDSGGVQQLGYQNTVPSAPPSYEEVVAGLLTTAFNAEGSRRSVAKGRTPMALEIAAKKGYASSVETLLRCGAGSNKQHLNNALVVAGSVVILQMLLGAGADPNACDPDGYSALHRAAQMGLEANVTALLRAGSLTEARDNWGNTPLHVAAQGEHEEVVRALLAEGASCDATNNEGKRPCDMARSRSLLSLLR